MSTLLSVLSAAQDLNVQLVDDRNADLSPRDVLVPLATLIAAIGGVVIGGRINRTTLTKLDAERHEREDKRELDRAEREDRLDAARAGRARELENTRHEREIAASKRQALGSLRVLVSQFERARMILQLESQSQDEDPTVFRGIDTSFRIRPEDLHAVAMWLPTDEDWEAIALHIEAIESCDAHRQEVRERLQRDEEAWVQNYKAHAAKISVSLDTMIKQLEDFQPMLEAEAPPTRPAQSL